MSHQEQNDYREGCGCIVWTMAAIGLAIALAMMSCGCEDDGDTVYEAQDITVGSNSSVIVVNDNTGLVSVDNTTTGEDDPSIFVSGNTGRVYVVNRPYVPESEP